MTFNKTSLVVSAISLLLLNACSSNYQVSTNLDKKNFEEYFSPTKVKIFNSEQEFTTQYQFLGLVEGQDCQQKSHHAAPDEIAARTEARRLAYQKNANAIIFTGCALIEDDKADKQCLTTLVCYGKAYHLVPSN